MKKENENEFLTKVCDGKEIEIPTKFINDLSDLNLKKVFPLDEKETIVIRLSYGLGCEKSISKDIAKKLKVGMSRVGQIKYIAERRIRLYFKNLDTSLLKNNEIQLADLDLSTYILRALFYNKIRTLQELLEMKEEDISKLEGIGKVSANEIIGKVKAKNLSFKK